MTQGIEAMKQFENFNDYYHKKTIVCRGAAVYEIWHQRSLSDAIVEELAARIHQETEESGNESGGLFRHDFRDFYR